MEYCHEGRNLKASKHLLVIQHFTTTCHFLFHLSLHALLFQRAQAVHLCRWPCSSLLSQWDLLAWEAARPSAPTIILSLNRWPKSVLALSPNTREQGRSQSRCWAACWLAPPTNRDSTKYCAYAVTHTLPLNQTSAWQLISVCVRVCVFEECSWKQVSSLCHETHIHTHPCTHTAAKHRIELLSRHSSSTPVLQSLTEVENHTTTETKPLPKPFYWNPPVASEWRGHTGVLAPAPHPPAPSAPT